MTTKLHDFRLASHAHLAGATSLLHDDHPSQSGNPPAKLHSSAAYLASVSLECSLKARLLARGGCESDDALKAKQPSVYKVLFKGKEGHDLGELAKKLRLAKFVATEGKAWTEDETWRRMASSERPYSLRYGSEHLNADDAAGEVERVKELSTMLLSGLGTATKRRSRR